MATSSRGNGRGRRSRGPGRSGYHTSPSSRGACNDDVDDLVNQFGGLNTGPPRPSRGSRPTFRTKSRGGPRPWPGPRKQSAFVFYFLGEKLYALRNINNLMGTPGGVRWDEDDSLEVTIKRKISHEVGIDIIPGEYRYFVWQQHANHLVRFYCKTLTRQEADKLPTGNIDNDSEEIEGLWLRWERQLQLDSTKIREHIVHGLQSYKRKVEEDVAFDGTEEF